MEKPADRANPQRDLKVVVERTFAASRARVFQAWTDPVLMEKWFAPVDRTAFGVEANAVVGGRYRIGMRGQDGAASYVSGRYIEVRPPDRLVFTWAWDTDPPGYESLVTIEFFDQGGSTRLVLTHQQLQTPEDVERHSRGWVSCLQHLEFNVASGGV